MIIEKQSKKEAFDYNLSMDELKYDHSLYKRLEYIPNFEPMLDLLLEHNVSGQLSKELMKREYDMCYEDYIFFYNERKKSLISGDRTKEDFRDLNITINYYYKHCPDKNGTFTTKGMISWRNDYQKHYNMFSFLSAYKDNKEKVIYIGDYK